MKLLLKTKLLMVIASLILGLTIWDLAPRSTLKDSLPHIEAVGIKEISRIELTSMGTTITLEKQSGEWVQVAPLSGLADVSRINSMILNFRKPIAMDVLVEIDPSDGGKAYGLDSSNAVTVEFWTTDSDSPQVSFLLGNDTELGASFVRISGSKSVYRAHVGGRRRFIHKAGEWLNQRVLQLEMSELQSISIEGTDVESYTLLNGEQWTIEGSGIPTDTKRLSQALQTLLLMRKGEQSTQSIVNPWMRLTLLSKSGETQTLAIAKPVDRQTRLQIDDVVYTVPVLAFERFVSGARYFMDKRVLPIRSKDELDLIHYKTDLNDIIIQQDLSNGFWKVLQPSNVDLEMRDVFFMVNTLASLSSLLDVSLDLVTKEPKMTLEVRRLQGDVLRLMVFEQMEMDSVTGYLCQVEGSESAFIASIEDVEQIINGFGQSGLF